MVFLSFRTRQAFKNDQISSKTSQHKCSCVCAIQSQCAQGEYYEDVFAQSTVLPLSNHSNCHPSKRRLDEQVYGQRYATQ